MKCSKCGTEFEGKFCPECGTPIAGIVTMNQLQDQTQYQQNFGTGPLPTQMPTIIINNNNTNTNTNTNTNANLGNTFASRGISSKSKMITLLLAIFLGYWGIHYFYVGKTGMGILYLFTAGIFGIGWIMDIIRILNGSFKDKFGLLIIK